MNVPILWHLKVSPYNEKARWALDHKRVPHVRRAALAGRHQALAKKLSGGSTLPVLVVDGEAVGDSTRIIAEVERRHPEHPLYPADPDERRRALELEDHFDEELGPHVRLLVLHHLLDEPGLLLGTFAPDLPGPARLTARATFPLTRRRIKAMFGIDETGVALAYDKLAAAGRRFGVALQPSGYLVGDAFSVADLTLASMVGPVLCPEQWQYPQPQRDHELLATVREPLAEAGVLDWAREIYARHRPPSAAVAG